MGIGKEEKPVLTGLRHCTTVLCGMLLLSLQASAQSGMASIFSGDLVKPETGVYAWYEVSERATGKKYLVRHAVVGEENVKGKKGYWLEVEIIPQIGFPTIYKILLTGPAADPKNVHRLYIREGNNKIEEITPETSATEETPTEEKRETLGTETVTLPNNTLQVEHVKVTRGDHSIELWLSDAIPPLGIARMQSEEGEMVLQTFGKGGPDGQSKLNLSAQSVAPSQKEPSSTAEVPATPPSDREQQTPEPPRKKNFGAKKKHE